MSNKKALLIVDHGSRFKGANDMLWDVVKMMQKLRPDLIVEGAHMELCEPDIPAGIKACVEAGASEVTVHPYMLAPGRHATSDIPKMATEAAQAYPGLGFSVTDCLGVDDRIGSLILERAGL